MSKWYKSKSNAKWIAFSPTSKMEDDLEFYGYSLKGAALGGGWAIKENYIKKGTNVLHGKTRDSIRRLASPNKKIAKLNWLGEYELAR
jgi:hypothetical protein